jgi:hypothetical protein
VTPNRIAIAEDLALVLIRASILAGLQPDIERIAQGAFNVLHYGTPAHLDRLIDLLTVMHRIVASEAVA